MAAKGAWAVIYSASTNEVLIARRSQAANNPGLWNFPGGRVDRGESPSKALRRELNEEIGWWVADRELTPLEHPNLDPKGDRRFYVLRVTKPRNIKMNDEHDSWLWLNPALLRLFAFNPPSRFLLDQVNLHQYLR